MVLQGEGLVMIIPYQGATGQTLDQGLVRNVHETTAASEVLLVGRSVENITLIDTNKLRDIRERIESLTRTDNIKEIPRLNRAFHNLIYTNRLVMRP